MEQIVFTKPCTVTARIPDGEMVHAASRIGVIPEMRTQGSRLAGDIVVAAGASAQTLRGYEGVGVLAPAFVVAVIHPKTW